MPHPGRLALVSALSLLLALVPAGPVGAGGEQASPSVEVADPRYVITQRDAIDDQPPPALVVVDPSDSSQEQITPRGVRPIAGRWSPDGDLLAYVDAERRDDGVLDVGLVRISASDGTTQIPLADAGETVVRWFPDAAHLAFTDEQGRLATTDLRGPEQGGPRVRLLAQAAGQRLVPGDVSPDGRHVVALRRDADAREGDVVLVDVGQGTVRGVRSSGTARAPRFSPDGTRISFIERLETEGQDTEAHVLTVRLDGSDERTVFTGRMTSYAWSPDGAQVAGTRNRDVIDSDVVVADAVTAEERRLVDGGGGEAGFGDVSWSADGARLLVTVAGEGGSGVIAVDAVTGETAGVGDGNAYRPQSAPAGVVRLAGTGRIQTAVLASRRAFPEGAARVLVARADDYADALAAAPLAGGTAPVLLAAGDELPEVTAEEVRRLGAEEAIILGGTSALGVGVAGDLRAAGVEEVRRVEGDDRFGTAVAIAEELPQSATATTAFLVEGVDADPDRGWPDAVAVSALAAATGTPVLLTTTEELPATTRAALDGLDTVTVIGGPAAVSAAVEAEAGELAGEVRRIAGDTRYETSARLAEAQRTAGLGPEALWLATGTAYPDALAAGPAAAAIGARLALVDGRAAGLPSPLAAVANQARDVVVAGGLGAVGPRPAADAGARSRR